MDQSLYRRGIDLFNQQRFYDAHEILEDAWRETSGPERLFLQGLIQVAVGLHHHSTGNSIGAVSLLTRARRNLAGYPKRYCGIELAQFRDAVQHWQSCLTYARDLPAFPKISDSPQPE
jgi:uncharacterized protein